MSEQANPNGSKFTRFLSRFYIQKGCAFTHTSFAKPSGAFYIPFEHHNEFYRLYNEALDAGEDLHITEKNRHIGPLKVDLDFRWDTTNENTKITRKYTSAHVQQIAKTYMRIASEFLENKFNGDLHDNQDSDSSDRRMVVYVMEKNAPSINSQGQLKDGLHILFPNVVTRASVQYLIRNEAIEQLKDLLCNEMRCCNKPEDIIDEAIIERNNWLMYGSKKAGGEPYLVTKIAYRDDDDGSISWEVPAANVPLSHYVGTLSIRNKYDESSIKIEKSQAVHDFEEEQEKRRRKMEVARTIITEKANRTRNEITDQDVDTVRKLVSILGMNRVDNYNEWIRLGWCLRNIDHRVMNIWEEFSKKSRKYIEGECEKLWNHMKDGGLGMGTLHMWAKQDNPDTYREIMRCDLKELLFASRSGTHNDVGKVIHHMYKYDYVCTSVRHKTWYEFKNHRWHSCDGGFSLRTKISNDVWREYMAAVRDWSQRAMDTTSAADQNLFQDHAKRMNEIAMKLKTTNFKDNVMKECAELFYFEKFEELLDSNDNLIGFENGMFDLDTFEFRDGRPDDYVSYTTGNDFIEYDSSCEQIAAINRYLAQVLTKPQVREYVMKLFATFLHGAVKEQKFNIWTGSGSNSKSLMVDLFEKSFGEYCCKFPITLLTQKRAASNAATSELARAKGKRFACLQEPSEDEKLNIGLMKELSGGDKILARAIYKEPVEFKPQFKMLLLCNQLPQVPSDDGGTWRRIRVVEFTSKFVDVPTEENEFPIDMDLPNKMDAWRGHFMALLLEYFKLYKAEGISEPEEVLQCTREYKRNNDHLADFLHNCVEKKDSAFLSLNEAFAELKAWARDDNIPIKIPTKAELEKYMSKNLTKCVSSNNFKGFKGYRLKNRYQTIAEEDEEE